MSKKISERFKDFPEIIPDVIKMTEANSVIDIHEGAYTIENEGYLFKINGKITYNWLPHQGIRFYGRVISNKDKARHIQETIQPYLVSTNSFYLNEGIITHSTINSPSGSVTINGIVNKLTTTGELDIPVEKLRFTIPNLKKFIGSPVKIATPTSNRVMLNHFEFEDDEYKIIIDKCPDFDERKKKLDNKGGFITLYNGELKYKKGDIYYKHVQDVLYCLDTFLSFINGRRTATLFIQGLVNDTVIWTDYGSNRIDPHKHVQTWAKISSSEEFNKLWKHFRFIWQQKLDDKNFLISCIHWYVEANSNSAYTEGSIILAQTALELIFNWWIVEKKKIILGRDSVNMSASNKIRLILSQLNLSSNIPHALKHLQSTEKIIGGTFFDAPESIVFIRNAIVHSQESKRQKFNSMDSMAINEALDVYIWYIELALLCILDYDSDYFNRCSKELYETRGLQKVPWKENAS